MHGKNKISVIVWLPLLRKWRLRLWKRMESYDHEKSVIWNILQTILFNRLRCINRSVWSCSPHNSTVLYFFVRKNVFDNHLSAFDCPKSAYCLFRLKNWVASLLKRWSRINIVKLSNRDLVIRPFEIFVVYQQHVFSLDLPSMQFLVFFKIL